jgi:hypothetical protein
MIIIIILNLKVRLGITGSFIAIKLRFRQCLRNGLSNQSWVFHTC